MAYVQAIGGMIDLGVKGITIILMIIAASLAIKKKNNLVLGVAIVGNLVAYYFTLSPLICMLVSIACIIWASLTKSAEQKGEQPSKSSATAADNKPKQKKIGNIIGLILGIGLVVGPLAGYLRQEASLSDPTTQGVLILFGVIGALMIINNIFKLLEGDTSTAAPAAAPAPIKSSSKEKPQELSQPEAEEKKIRCRFCKKLYSAEYNGCPYCKKK